MTQGDALDENYLDLCSIISDPGNWYWKRYEDDDERRCAHIKYKLPEIPNKLKAYRARVTNENNKVMIAKGVKYKKEDIQRYDEQADLFIKEAKKLLEDKNNKLEKK